MPLCRAEPRRCADADETGCCGPGLSSTPCRAPERAPCHVYVCCLLHPIVATVGCNRPSTAGSMAGRPESQERRGQERCESRGQSTAGDGLETGPAGRAVRGRAGEATSTQGAVGMACRGRAPEKARRGRVSLDILTGHGTEAHAGALSRGGAAGTALRLQGRDSAHPGAVRLEPCTPGVLWSWPGPQSPGLYAFGAVRLL
ncbi:PREDICTED: uncharacterized protein LOC102029664 [Chinchilla lanigera]|uniref:uncharacterized protein LOC102029664 n=1 Tax=Chinchilla lanigera TaxID=34839 RepID=UPI00038ECEFA|nr:PREDICTED: uncharacterized protein LOC102029664 [Chinchilla lanigera]